MSVTLRMQMIIIMTVILIVAVIILNIAILIVIIIAIMAVILILITTIIMILMILPNLKVGVLRKHRIYMDNILQNKPFNSDTFNYFEEKKQICS